MQLKIILYLFAFSLGISVRGQQIHIEHFAIAKHAPKQKGVALLDLYTVEEGMTFMVGGVPVSPQEGDGYITLTMPHKATALMVQHPEYGQLNWKIPGKGVKRKKHYRADLVVMSKEKDFRSPKQWVVLHVSPKHCIVQVDSTMYLLEEGYQELYLGVGKHSLQIESPFFRQLTDTLSVTDSAGVVKHYQLEPYYAFLEVKTPTEESIVYLDQKQLGTGTVCTGRMAPGRYHLQVMDGDRLCYDHWIELEIGEKKEIQVSGYPVPLRDKTPLSHTIDGEKANRNTEEIRGDSVAVATSLVKIKAFNDSTEIWLNREYVGSGDWQGKLVPGFYAVSSVKEGLESRTTYFWVKSEKDMKITLMAPMADYGMINVICDEPGAKVYLNGILADETPCVLQNLPLNLSHHLRVVKGKRSEEKQIRLKGNDIINVRFKLK